MVRSPRKRQFGYESLEARNLLTAQMLLDFTTTQVGLNPTGFFEFEDEIFFSTSRNEARGLQLWKTDGTSAGTEVVSELPGWNVPFFQVVNDQLLAIVEDAIPQNIHGAAEFNLYRYDGTEFELIETIVQENPYGPRVLNDFAQAPSGRSYFSTNNGGPGSWSIWSTDGTDAIREVSAGFPSAGDLTFVASKLFTTQAKPESNSTSSRSIELYVFDPETSTMSLVRDIEPGRDGSFPTELTDVAGTLYFTAETKLAGRELWLSDGTEAGTRMVADLNAGATSSEPANLVVHNGGLYFTATDDAGPAVWHVASGATPRKLSSSETQPELREIDGALYFSTETNNETTLWTVADNDVRQVATFPDADVSLETYDDRLIVTARFESEVQVWQASDGENPNLIARFDADNEHVELLLVNDESFLFQTDGGSIFRATETEPNAQLMGVFPAELTELIAYSDMLIYAADSDHGTVLWATDGQSFEIIQDTEFRTTSSTIRFVDVGDGPLIIAEEGFDRNQFFYEWHHYYQATLFTSDGTPDGTIELQRGLSMPEVVNVFGGDSFHVDDSQVFFYTEGGPEFGALWKSDLTPEGTAQVTDADEQVAIQAVLGPEFFNDEGDFSSSRVRYGSSSYPSFSTPEGDYFIPQTKIMRREMTETGTSIVELVDFESLGITSTRTGVLDLLEPTIAVNDGIVYFSARHPQTGAELWQSDGTLEGTRIVADIMPGPGDSDATLFGTSNGVVYFTADDGVHGRELWAVTSDSEEQQDSADLNADGVVDFADFLVLSDNFGTTTNRREDGDIDGNSLVDFADFLLFADEFKERAV